MRQLSINRLLRAGALYLTLFTFSLFAADPKIPDTFLPAQGKLREVLQTPVSGTFKDSPAPDVITALCAQLPANNVYRGGSLNPPSFTGTFKDAPLRTALFQIAQATHITIEWSERSDGGKLISAHE